MPKKPNIPIQEANEAMKFYFKITGRKIIDEPNPQAKLEQVHQALQDYLKTKTPTIHF
jgi:hypothetical protein